MKYCLEKNFTEEGIKSLENRLKNLTKLYIKGLKYPFSARIYGFIPLKIISRIHHEGMIDELAQILGKEKIILEVKSDDI